MLLEIEEAAFYTTDHPPMVDLLDMIAQERHVWRPTLPVADAAERYIRHHLPSMPAFLELVQKCLVEASSPRRPDASVLRVGAERLRELVTDLGQSAVLLVEDCESEECFLLAVARAFGRERIILARSRNWLAFVHAGGADRMPTFVARERAKFQVHPRVAALLDSDRQVPRQQTKKHRLAEQIREQGSEAHVWQGRELENYVPTRVWLQHCKDEAKVGMLLKMRLDQRACLDLKKGLGKALQNPDAAHLFDSLPEEIRQAWQSGLESKGKMPKPLVPEGMTLTEEDFAELGPAAVAELRAVLDMIEKIL